MRSRKNSNATVTYDVLYIETTTFDSRVNLHLLPFDFIPGLTAEYPATPKHRVFCSYSLYLTD